jgi:hypothetical protein
MNSGRDLIYSNDLCPAFLTSIVRIFQAQHPNHYLGRTALQKLAYFAQALGTPIPCSFDIYTYGPYSDSITFSVESLMADDVLVDQSFTTKYSNYKIGPNSTALLSAFNNEIEPYESTICRVVSVLGGFSPSDLELIATLHFISRRAKQLRGVIDKNQVIAEFKAIKKNKFSDAEINTWFDALVGAGLIQLCK